LGCPKNVGDNYHPQIVGDSEPRPEFSAVDLKKYRGALFTKNAVLTSFQNLVSKVMYLEKTPRKNDLLKRHNSSEFWPYFVEPNVRLF